MTAWTVGRIGVGSTTVLVRRTTIQLVSNSHSLTLALKFVLPDSTEYVVPGVNSGGSGPEVEFGDFVLEAMQVHFDPGTGSYSQTWNGSDTQWIRRAPISGAGYVGYRFSFDDGGPGTGFTQDGDFNDIIMDVKSHDV